MDGGFNGWKISKINQKKWLSLFNSLSNYSFLSVLVVIIQVNSPITMKIVKNKNLMVSICSGVTIRFIVPQLRLGSKNRNQT